MDLNTPVELERLFAPGPRKVREVEESLFDELSAGRPLVLYGAGRIGRKTLAGLRSLGRDVLAFADSNPSAFGTERDGTPVLAPEEAARRFGKNACFVVTVWNPAAPHAFAEVGARLKALGCLFVTSFIPLFWKHPALFLPHTRLDSPHRVFDDEAAVRATFDLWLDEESRREFVAQLRALLSPNGFEGLPGGSPNPIYFENAVCPPRDDEVFVDCGAYDGDTLRTFLSLRGDRFRRLVAYEADPTNFARLSAWAAGLPAKRRARIVLRPLAVAAERTTVRFDASADEGAAIRENGALLVEAVSLDEDLDEGPAPTFLKFDVEGAEPAALQGCRRILEKSRPALAVSAYHLQDHLWRLPLLVDSLAPGSRFLLRRYSPGFVDLVCYAIPEERLATAFRGARVRP
jgi:FkbM family methyltransferase